MAKFDQEQIDLDVEPPKDVVRIDVNDGVDPSDEQTSFVTKANELAKKLQRAQAADKRRTLVDELLDPRQSKRTEIAGVLSKEVEQFILDPTSPRVGMIDTLGARYEAELRNFVVRPAPADHLRYAGHFEILESAETLSASEKVVVDQVRTAVAELADDDVKDVNDKTRSLSPAAIEARVKLRSEAAKDYRALIDKYPNIESDFVEKLALRRGAYQALRDRTTKKLFRVIEMAPTAQDETGQDEGYPELHVQLKSGLPSPEDNPSPAKLELYVQLYKTSAVMRAVCVRASERIGRKWWVPEWVHKLYLRLTEPPRKAAEDHARRLHKEFLSKLNSIALVGLEMNFTELAKFTLDELRIEYFMLQAERIKKQHAKTLGRVAVSLSIVFISCYAYIHWGMAKSELKDSWNYFFMNHKNFLLAATGAAIATWASFVARQVAFRFDDLVMLDENSVPALLRITFVIVLTMAACLFFWTGAINIEIGELKTKGESFRASGTIAVLIGLLCGFSERALAQAITGRSAAFVKTVGGA